MADLATAPRARSIDSVIARLRQKANRNLSDRHFAEILSGSALSLVGQCGSMLAALLSSVIVARYYGAREVGVLALVISFLNMVSIFTVFGTNTAILRLIPEHITKYSVRSAWNVYRATEKLAVALSIAVGIASVYLAEPLATYVFHKPSLSSVFAIAGPCVVFSSLLQLSTSATRGLRLIKLFAVMQALPASAMLLVLVALTWTQREEHTPVYAQLAAFGIAAAVGTLLVHHAFRRGSRKDEPVERLRVGQVASVAFPMLLTASVQFAIAQAGIMMLGIFRTEAEAGYFAVATRLAILASFVLKSINTIAAPKFSELHHSGNTDELFRIARKSTKLLFWITAPILAGVVILGLPILNALYGPAFQSAYIPLVLLAVGQFINSISGSTGYFMNMTGHEKAFRNIVAVAAALNIGLGLILIPSFGVIGAGIVGMVTLATWNLGTLWFIKWKYAKTIGYFPFLRRG